MISKQTSNHRMVVSVAKHSDLFCKSKCVEGLTS